MTDSKMPERIWASDYDDNDGGGYWWLDPYANTGLVEYIRADIAQAEIARRVIAAERMHEAFGKRLFGADNVTECHMSIIAYREASK